MPAADHPLAPPAPEAAAGASEVAGYSPRLVGPGWYPPLTRWGRTWRLLLVLLISGVAWSTLAPYQLEQARWWFAVDLVLGLGALVLVHFRRRWPVAVAVVLSVVSTVSASSAGPSTLATASLATRRRWRELVPVGALAVAGGLVFTAMSPSQAEVPDMSTRVGLAVNVGITLLVIAAVVAWGLYIGSRRELLATLRERADRAEAEQSLRVSQARRAERTRIAREMHDVLAHRISLVTVHAGALVYREDLTPAQVHETALVIEEGSRQALVELREVLGVLREGPGDADPEKPQPSADDLPALVAEARGAGLRLDLHQDAQLAGLPDGVGRTLYRVVQEGLTNARKHAPGSRVRLVLGGGPGAGVDVEVHNPLEVGASHRAPASGLGLVGLTERTALAGGRLTWHVTPQREFVLRAWLPWPS